MKEKPSKSNVNIIVPETSLFAIQINDLQKTFEILNEQSWFEAVAEVPLINTLFVKLNSIDSLEKNGVLKSNLTKLKLWVTIHATSSNDLTPMFIVKSSGFDWSTSSIVSIVEDLTSQELNIEIQSLNDREIVSLKSPDFSIATIIEGDFLIFSENALLIEDAIRSIQEENKRLLLQGEKFDEVNDLSLIVNTNRLNELNAIFFEDKLREKTKNPFSGNLILSLSIDEDGISFQGEGDGSQSDFEKKPTPIFAKNIIPLTSNSFQWKPFKVTSPDLSDLLEEGICVINMNVGGQASSKTYVLPVQDTALLKLAFDKVANNHLLPSDSAIYKEQYINSEIGYINSPEFLSNFLGTEGANAGAPYYTSLQNTLLLSDNLDALKTVLDDFDSETTWGKSVDQRRILDDMIQETDLTLVQDFEFAADPLKDKLKTKWKTMFEEHPEIMNVLSLFKLQFNKANNGVLVSGSLAFNSNFKVPDRQEESSDNVMEGVMANVFADTLLTTKPFVVRNHVNSGREVIFQDMANNIYLSTKQGDVQWKKNLGGQVVGDIHQIDYYNNKKLQYLMFTDSLIHLIDRNGDNVEGFPKPFESELPFDGTDVIDYNNSKRYRYLAKDRRGSLSLFDKQGGLLEGWEAKPVGGALLHTPFHVRIRGRDCFVVVERNGNVNLLNRKGEDYSGFPVSIGNQFEGDVALTKGANFSQTLISLVSAGGELVQINLNGQVVNKKQLLKTAVNTTFSLSFDALKTTFKVVRNDGRKLTFFDANGQEHFSIDYPNSRELDVDFYNFRNGKEVYVVRDTKEGVMRIINGKGEFLTSLMPTNERVSILYYQSRLEYEVFVNFANQMNVYAVKPF